MDTTLQVLDNVLPIDHAFALRQEVTTLAHFGPQRSLDGAVYQDVSTECQPIPALPRALARAHGVVEDAIDLKLSAWRAGMIGDKDDTFCHADGLYATHAAVYYLSAPRFDGEGGTAFYRHRLYGIDQVPPEDWIKQHLNPAGFHAALTRDTQFDSAELWQLTGFVGSKFNRLITYPCPAFHARRPAVIEAPFGRTIADSRLVWVAFFNIHRQTTYAC